MGTPDMTRPCDSCGADPYEPCLPGCTAAAVAEEDARVEELADAMIDPDDDRWQDALDAYERQLHRGDDR